MGQAAFDRHLISGWGGNLSCRVGRRVFITGRHAPLGFLTAADLVRIDHAGRPRKQTSVHRARRLCIWLCISQRGTSHRSCPSTHDAGIFIDP